MRGTWQGREVYSWEGVPRWRRGLGLAWGHVWVKGSWQGKVMWLGGDGELKEKDA